MNTLESKFHFPGPDSKTMGTEMFDIPVTNASPTEGVIAR